MRTGMSLVETLVAISVLGATAIMYGSAWSAQNATNDTPRAIELATEIYVRQVATLRRKSVKDADCPFREDAYQARGVFYPEGGVPPRFLGATDPGTSYYSAVSPANQLSYNTSVKKLLDRPGANCLEIVSPVGAPDPWIAPLANPGGVSMVDLGFSVRVFASRVQDVDPLAVPFTVAQLNTSPRQHLHQLIKYRVIVLRNGVEVLSGEFLQEVR